MNMILALSNHKGGVGKTTSTVNIGACMSRMGRKILLVDLDPQANLSQSLGIQSADKTIYGALRGKHPIEVITINENLHLVPSTL
ncbi:MAG: AAA family ATPase, partial [Chlorobiales bacterium]|nr:AAA family ATPase [Chlorobiales bacterium]